MGHSLDSSFERTLIILKALSDETRLRIYRLLLEEPLCVCELIYILGYKQSRVSHCLRVLRHADLVESRREGRLVSYSVKDGSRKNKMLDGLRLELALPGMDRRNRERCKRNKIKEQFEPDGAR